MSLARIFTGTVLAMLAFAGNSILCRLALSHTSIDAASFTAVRLVSGAIVLWVAVRIRGGNSTGRGNWVSALALWAYAAGFSLAIFGLVALLFPGLSAPPPGSAALMLGAGVAWGVYSLRGRGAGDSTRVTAGNFLRAAPVALVVALVGPHLPLDPQGMTYAVFSGALTSGLGYTIWYTVLPSLGSATAAVVQLCVPVIATLGGSMLLGEAMTGRIILASGATLGGIAVVIQARRR